MAYHRYITAWIRHIARIYQHVWAEDAFERWPGAAEFCVQALSGQTLTVYGDGKQTRSFFAMFPI